MKLSIPTYNGYRITELEVGNNYDTVFGRRYPRPSHFRKELQLQLNRLKRIKDDNYKRVNEKTYDIQQASIYEADNEFNLFMASIVLNKASTIISFDEKLGKSISDKLK